MVILKYKWMKHIHDEREVKFIEKQSTSSYDLIDIIYTQQIRYFANQFKKVSEVLYNIVRLITVSYVKCDAIFVQFNLFHEK